MRPAPAIGPAAAPARTRENADPLHVECLSLLERLIAGNLLSPWAADARHVVLDLTARLKSAVAPVEVTAG